MEKINGKWIHKGREYEVVDGPCSTCPFKPSKEGCPLEHSCCPIGIGKIFKLKESKMRKEELNFKVLTPTVERAKTLLEALEKAGLAFIHQPRSEDIKAVEVFKGALSYWSNPWDVRIPFDGCDQPEVTFAEALELLKRVEPVAPEFDIRLRDEVLVSDVDSDIWELCEFARVHTDCFVMIGYGYGQKND